MKKILSLVLSIAIILGAVLTANFILAETEAPVREGGYMQVTGRNNQNAGPRQLLGDALNASGDGTYYMAAWVRIPENTGTKSVSIMVYPGSWPAAILTQNVTGSEWTLISGEVTISGTANFADNENIYFRIQTGSEQTDNCNIDFDSIVLKKKTGSTYGENLIQDSECELGLLTTWYGTGNAVLTNPVSSDTSLYGVQVEYKSDTNLFVSKKDQFNFCLDGKKAEVTVYNAGTENILLQLQVRSSSWSTLGGGTAEDWVTIAPNKAATITTEIADDKVASGNWAVLVTNGAGKTGKLVLCNLTAQQALSLRDAGKWNVNTDATPAVVANPEVTTATPVTPVATPDPNALHGVQVEYSAHAETGFIAKQSILDSVRNGDTATVKIYNPGTESIKVALQIRKANWATVAGNNEWHVIGAGEGKTITVKTSAENTFEDNFVVLVAEPGATGKLVLCDVKYQQATSLADSAKWYATTATVVDNPEFTEPETPGESGGEPGIPAPEKPDLKVEEGYITVTNRKNQNSGPRQYLGDVLKASGDGKYYISAWVKIPENDADKKVSVIISATFATENKYKYPTVTKTVSDGEWTLISGEIEVKDTNNITQNTDAYFRIQTGSAITDNWDIWFDGITINKKNADETFGKNIITNADFNKEDPLTWASDPNCKITFVDAKEKLEVQKPTGVIITALKDTETNHVITNTGIVTKNDIKDGKITKTFTILNQGDDPVKITLSLQAEHTKEDGGKMWSAPGKGFTALIEPGDKQELTYTMDVNEDGTITLTGGNNDMDHQPEEFFARFDILEADGNPKVIEGTKLVILNSDPDVVFTAGDKTNVTVEVTYSKQFATSDMIPFSAFAILPLVVAFVLVIKKRKEN